MKKSILTNLIGQIRGIILLFIFSVISIASAVGQSDSKGSEFWLMFNSNLGSGSITLFITSDVNTSGTVSGPSFSTQTFSVTANTVTSISLDASIQTHTNDLVDNKGIHVVANDEVTVYGLNQVPSTTDAFLGLPIDVLGTEYRIISYSGLIGSQLGIVATENGTTVTITPSVTVGSHTAGVPFTKTFNAGDAYQISQSGIDLTGTLVTSDKPIGVFGSVQCANVPTNARYCDHLVEMLPPTSAWGTKFATVPLKTRNNGDTWRFLAAEDGTIIEIDGVTQPTINKGAFIEKILTTSVIVESNKPILVTQYSNGTTYDNVTSDPFMMLIPPLEQFLASYTTGTPSFGFSGHYVNLIVPNSAIGALTMDGIAIGSGAYSAIGSSGFSSAQITVSAGSHTFTSALPFGAFSYGFGSYDSYGYAGGQSFSPVATVTTLDVTPQTGSDQVNNSNCWEATVLDQFGDPVVGVKVDFDITGVNSSQSGFANTNASGVATFCYAGANGGNDAIYAHVGSIGDNATFTWTSCVTPTFTTCPVDKTVDSDINTCGAAISYNTEVTGTPAPSLSYEFSGATIGSGSGDGSGASFGIGTTTVTITAENICGTDVCSFAITVEDNQNPTISCPANITINSDQGECGAKVCYPSPIASDNCIPATPSGYKYIGNYGASYYYQSINTMDFDVAKANAIAAGGHLVVITSAAENAVFVNNIDGDAWLGGYDIETEGTWTWDNCELFGYNNFSSGEPNGGLLENNLEIYPNGSWNDISGTAGAYARYGLIEIEGAAIHQTAGLPQNSVFPVGTTTNTFMVKDASGNTNTCSFDVTVDDGENPFAIAQDITVQLDANGVASIVAADIDNGSSDNCGIASISIDKTDFDCSNICVNNSGYQPLDLSGITGGSSVSDVSVGFCDMTFDGVSDQSAGVSGLPAGLSSGTFSINANTSGVGDIYTLTFSSPVNLRFSQSAGGQGWFDNSDLIEFSGDANFNVSDPTGDLTDITGDGTQTIEFRPTQVGSHESQASAQWQIETIGITQLSMEHKGVNQFTQFMIEVDGSSSANVVTLTVNDVNGNTSTSTATVTVEDNINPNAIAQDITVQLDANGAASIVAGDIDNGSNDNCGVASLGVSPSSFTCANVGANTVTLTVTDVNGNVSTATANVEVEDNVKPTVITQDIVVQLDANGAVSITANDINDGSNDACGIDNIECSRVGTGTYSNNLANGILSSGSTEVEFVTGGGAATNYRTTLGTTCNELWYPNGTFCDDGSAANSPDASYKINTHAGATWRNNNPGSDYGILVADLGSTQDFNAMSVFQMFSDGKLTHINAFYHPSTSNTAPAHNDAGWVAFAPYTAVGPGSISGNVVSDPLKLTFDNVNTRYVKFFAYNDGSYGNSTWIEIRSIKLFSTTGPCDFTCADVGTNTLTLKVTDNNGNVETGTATITVEDNVNPTVLTQDIVVQLDANGAVSITANDVDNGSNDACGIASTSVSPSSFVCSNVGNNTVTLTVTDNNGNVETATANVKVEDNIVPTALTQNITIDLDEFGTASITPQELDNSSYDNCGITSMNIDISNFDCSNVGENEVLFSVDDAAGNYRTIPSDLIGHWNFEDDNPQSDLTGNWGDLILSGTASISNGELDVNNGSSMARTSSYTGPVIANKTLVTYLSLDALNNQKGSGITIDAINSDNFDGIVYAERQANRWMSGSSNFSRTSDFSPGFAESAINVPVMIAITYEQVNTSQVKLTLYRNGISYGSYIVNNFTTWSANNAEIIFGARHYYNNSNSQIGALDAHIDEAMIFGKALTAQEVANLYMDSSRFSRATVTVQDNVNPVALAQNVTVQLDDNGNGSTTAEAVDNGSNDACGIKSLVLSKTDFTCDNVGDNTVTLTVTDNNDNVSTIDATVTVEDNVAPEALCQNVTVTLSGGTASVTPEDIDNGSNDACGILSLELDNSNWDCTNIGDNAVTLTVTDNNNNVSTCDATVTVVGKIPTVEVTQAELQQFCQGGTLELTATAGEGTMFTYAWTPTAETTDVIYVDESDTYGVTVTNEFGCFVRGGIEVEYERSDLLASYTILATDKKVELKKGSHVQTGGVGVFGYKYKYYLKGKEYEDKIDGEIKVKYESSITGPTTFARAVEIEVEEGSTVTTQINSIPDVEIPEFVYNPHCKDKDVEDVKVKKDEEVTLTGSVYGKVDVDKGGKVTFTNSTIYLEDLQTNYDVTIDFTAPCVNMVVCDKVDLKKNNSFNPSNNQVLMYLEKGLKVDKNSTVNSSVFTLYSIDVNGGDEKKDESTKMTGMFIAKDVKSDNAVWNWRPECNACEALSNKTGAEPETHTLNSLAEEELITINLYPNPNNGNFGLDVFAENDGMMNVTVFDMFGKEIYTIDNQELSGFTYVPISLDGVRRAQYFVRVTIDGKVFTKAVFVNP